MEALEDSNEEEYYDYYDDDYDYYDYGNYSDYDQIYENDKDVDDDSYSSNYYEDDEIHGQGHDEW